MDHFSQFTSPQYDDHVTDLIVLPPNLDLHQDSFILERKAIIQVFVLNKNHYLVHRTKRVVFLLLYYSLQRMHT
jgi:hypothetical protein